MPAKILIIDDEESMCNFMEIMLVKEGYEVDTTTSAHEGVGRAKDSKYDLVIADLNMPEMSGIEVLREVRKSSQDQDLIVMTAYATVDTAIEAMKEGATDYITKPFKVDEVKLVIEKSINNRQLKQENEELKQQLHPESAFEKFIGTSEAVVALKKLALRVARSDSTVLILGESGTGKDLIAKAIHEQSDRSNGPFVTINCGALPENLLESELFGHKKGSFTGAIKDKDGLFKVADGGTFFLDEVGNTSMAVQIKLLRVLEDKIFTPVGGTNPIEVDVRLIAATNADLEADVKAGNFRADLFYRLNVIPIHIPPLRERREDIDLLVRHFVKMYCLRLNLPMKEIAPDAVDILRANPWTGNVRELENTIERAVLLSRSDVLSASDFPERIKRVEEEPVLTEQSLSTPTLESIEKAYIHFIMSQADGKKSEAAKILGIDASTLYRKIARYGLDEFLPKKNTPNNSGEK